MPGILDKPSHWLERAEEARTIAEQLADLHEPAALTDAGVQRVERFGLLEFCRAHDGLAERRHAEVDDGRLQGAVAEPASGRAPKRFACRAEMVQCDHQPSPGAEGLTSARCLARSH